MTPQTPIAYKKPRPRPPILLLLGMLAVVAVMIGGGIAVGTLLATNKVTPVPPLVKPAPVQTQLARVNGYGWTNKEVGAAHIPVERAMQIIVAQGLPPLKELPATPVPSPAPGSNLPGAALFTQLGCVGCHGDANSPLAPTLHGVYGKPVKLANGQTVTADDAYFKESILDPQAKIVEGYQPVMPSFKGKVTDDQINQLIDYIKSLGGS